MRGFNVLHPMGWDSYGLPAEALRHAHRHPPHRHHRPEYRNISQADAASSFSYDWERELATADPDFVRWTGVDFP